jgi:hypothetical protein
MEFISNYFGIKCDPCSKCESCLPSTIEETEVFQLLKKKPLSLSELVFLTGKAPITLEKVIQSLLEGEHIKLNESHKFELH